MPNYSPHVDNWQRQRQGLEKVKRSKVSVSIREDLLKQLDQHAESRPHGGASRSSIIELAVRHYLGNQR